MRLWLLIIYFFFNIHFQAQEGFRVKHFVANSTVNNSKAIFETNPGNYIGCGFSFDTLNNLNSNRIVMIGLGPQGQALWAKKYGNKKLEYLNNPLITRSFYKQANFIYLACCARDSNNKQIGVFIKFDLNGDTLWQKIFRDPDPLEDVIPQMVTGSVDGGFLMTGFFQNSGSSPYSKCLLIKTDANGNELWRKKIAKPGPNVQDGKAIVQDSVSKKIVIVGYQYGSTTDSYDNVLVLDSLGNKLNQVNYTAGGNLFDLIQTKDKKFVAVGLEISSQTVGGYNLISSFAVKFDVNNPKPPIWTIDSYDQLSLTNNFNCVYENENEDLMIGGDLDTLHLKNLPAHIYNRLTKVDKDGNIKWNRVYDYCANTNVQYYQSLKSLTPTSNGGILAALQLLNSNLLFFVKYDSTGCDSSLAYCAELILSGVKEFKVENSKFKIYPNPAKDFLNVETNSAEGTESDSYRISFVDIYGREVKRVKLEQKHKIDLNDLSKGIYFLNISKNKETLYTTKLIKE